MFSPKVRFDWWDSCWWNTLEALFLPNHTECEVSIPRDLIAARKHASLRADFEDSALHEVCAFCWIFRNFKIQQHCTCFSKFLKTDLERETHKTHTSILHLSLTVCFCFHISTFPEIYSHFISSMHTSCSISHIIITLFTRTWNNSFFCRSDLRSHFIKWEKLSHKRTICSWIAFTHECQKLITFINFCTENARTVFLLPVFIKEDIFSSWIRFPFRLRWNRL